MDAQMEQKELADAQLNIRILRRLNMTGKTFLDLGANVGNVAQAALDYFNRVIAVEAHPFTLIRLKAKLGDDKRVKIIAGAVMAKGGQKLFISTPKNSTGASVSDHKRRKLEGYYQEITSIAFNDLMRKYKPSCIKMDIEGCEHEILATGNLSGVTDLIVEFHNTRSPKGYQRYLVTRNILEAQGFVMRHPAKLSLLPDGSAARTLFFPAGFQRG